MSAQHMAVLRPPIKDPWPFGRISVELRLLANREDKLKAFANVEIPLDAHGAIRIEGFSVVYCRDDQFRVMPPARKGASRWFETVSLTGSVQKYVEAAVLAEYRKQIPSDAG